MKNSGTENRSDLLSKITILVIIILAALFVATGGLLYILDSGSLTKSYSTFNAVDTYLRSPKGILQNAIRINPRGLIQFGILLLIIVPTVRVFIFLFSFIIQKDWLYCAVSSIVFIVLLYSFFGF